MNPVKFRVTKTSIGEDESDATYESFNTLEEAFSWCPFTQERRITGSEEMKKFCWHKFEWYAYVETLKKTLPNGNRCFESVHQYKCVKCGLVRKSWIKTSKWVWAGEKSHDEIMAGYDERQKKAVDEIIEGIDRLKLEVKK